MAINAADNSTSERDERSSRNAGAGVGQVALTEPFITLFAIPKPFGSGNDHIQKNAIRSWARLAPKVDVVLLGEDESLAAFASESGVRHFAGLRTNEFGTPLVCSGFEIAKSESRAPILLYCNADIILGDSFVTAIESLHASEMKEFVAFGRRLDATVEQEIDFDAQHLEQQLRSIESSAKKCSIVCKEFFAFTRDAYPEIPPFAVGRGNWDNWMIHDAKSRGIPVVDISSLTTVLHQRHDYSHFGKGRWNCYVAGDEASQNQILAGGRNLISGSTGTWKLDQHGLRRNRLANLNLPFWFDLPRFLRLMMNLMTDR